MLGLLDAELVLLGCSTSEPLVLKGTSTINTLVLLDADILGNCLRTSDTTAGGSGSIDSDGSARFSWQRSWKRKRCRGKRVTAEAEAICQPLPRGKR